MTPIKALVFDVQGTLVDFYAPLMREGARLNVEKGVTFDWAALSQRWRALYRAGMDEILDGIAPWRGVDQIYRTALDQLLDETSNGAVLTAQERDDFNQIWTRLDPWPDSVAGLARLRQRFVAATLSNASMAALVRLAKRAGLGFDAILSAELARSFKPDPAVYRLAVDYLGCPASAIMLVACHKYDLAAARAFGMATAFISRPLEFGPDARPDVSPDPTFTLNARDLMDLADRLGA
jgi:2-haloacid dehalogenase